MRRHFDRLHARLGDFWFYSLMVFLASRAADALNVFVGLWLVPKYVGQDELGAVMPLTSFATALAMPVGVFAMVFMKEVNALATRREFGQMKTLMRGVFIAAGVLLVIALAASRILLPAFLTRIRIVEGSLGVLILASAFTASIAPVYTNALQALKKFRAISMLHVMGAPLRLLAMLATMPFRAISGYFVGQCAPHVAHILGSIFFLRKELATPACPYWSASVRRRFSRLMFLTFAAIAPASICGVVESMVLRQRLPDVESAAYYLVTRFSDIAAYLAIPLTATLFPFTAESAEQGKPTKPLVLKCMVFLVAINTALAFLFALIGKPVLQFFPNGDNYTGFAWAIPWAICITTLIHIQTLHTSTEISAGRFKFLKWWLPVNIIYPLLLLLVTGHGYFSELMPSAMSAFLAIHNVTSLKTMMIWMTAAASIKALFSAIDLSRQHAAAGSKREG